MKRFALIGRNIAYSLSPRVHRAIYKEVGADAKYVLMPLEDYRVGKDNSNLMALDGFNVTQPYKKKIISLLDGNNSIYPAVNTVLNVNGDWIGYNTDALGFKADILTLPIDVKNSTAIVYGAGGMASVSARVLTDLGTKVYMHNRTVIRAEHVAVFAGARLFHDMLIDTVKPDFIVNCSSRGLYDNSDFDYGGADFSRLKVAYDTIYTSTYFLEKAKELSGGKALTLNGKRMLMYQAIFADELFLNIEINDKDILANRLLKLI